MLVKLSKSVKRIRLLTIKDDVIYKQKIFYIIYKKYKYFEIVEFMKFRSLAQLMNRNRV